MATKLGGSCKGTLAQIAQTTSAPEQSSETLESQMRYEVYEFYSQIFWFGSRKRGRQLSLVRQVGGCVDIVDILLI
eukprot:5161789-Amphidinium_carterae.1